VAEKNAAKGESMRGENQAVTGGEMELLLVRIGRRRVALDMSEVKHIVPLPYDFGYGGGNVEDYYAFEGVPLRFISGWDATGEKTIYEEYEALQPMLPQRRQDHLDWIASLDHSIRTGAEFTKARNPHECAFGQWFYGYRARDRRLSVLLACFEQPHAHVHSLADTLLAMAASGRREEALQKLEEARTLTLTGLLDLFDSAEALMGTLQRRIAIILEKDGTSCALGADMVLDIVRVPDARITYEGEGDARRAKLFMLDDDKIVPLFRWDRVLESAPPMDADAMKQTEVPAEQAG